MRRCTGHTAREYLGHDEISSADHRLGSWTDPTQTWGCFLLSCAVVVTLVGDCLATLPLVVCPTSLAGS